MDDLKKRVLNQAIKMLEGLKVQYEIIDEDGNKYGGIEQKKAKRKFLHRRGTLKNHIEQVMGPFPAVGETKDVPCGQYEPLTIQACLSSLSYRLFGSKAITTTINRETNTVKVYRIF